MTDTININGYTFKMTKRFQKLMSIYHKIEMVDEDIVSFINERELEHLVEKIDDETARMIFDQAGEVCPDHMTDENLEIWRESMFYNSGIDELYAEWKHYHA